MSSSAHVPIRDATETSVSPEAPTTRSPTQRLDLERKYRLINQDRHNQALTVQKLEAACDTAGETLSKQDAYVKGVAHKRRQKQEVRDEAKKQLGEAELRAVKPAVEEVVAIDTFTRDFPEIYGAVNLMVEDAFDVMLNLVVEGISLENGRLGTEWHGRVASCVHLLLQVHERAAALAGKLDLCGDKSAVQDAWFNFRLPIVLSRMIDGQPLDGREEKMSRALRDVFRVAVGEAACMAQRGDIDAERRTDWGNMKQQCRDTVHILGIAIDERDGVGKQEEEIEVEDAGVRVTIHLSAATSTLIPDQTVRDALLNELVRYGIGLTFKNR